MFAMEPPPELPAAPPEFTSVEADATAELIRLALAEDLGDEGDRTGDALIDQQAIGQVEIRNRVDGTVCGLPVVTQLFETLDDRVTIATSAQDGQRIGEPSCLATLAGPVRSLLAGERTALNFLGYLSGIATQVAAHVAVVAGTNSRVLDTRKTLPGWRRLAKYAVACGGGTNHRMGLFDGVLIKDNHLAGRGDPLAVASAVTAARDAVPENLPVQVEVDTIEQLTDALRAAPDMVLLDNMPPGELARAVTIRDERSPGVLLEASGGITLESLAEVAATGVDRISMGALTHSVPNWDVGFDWVAGPGDRP